MINAAGDRLYEVRQKWQNCLKNTGKWYRGNRLKIDSYKSKVMLVGSKAQVIKYSWTYIKLRSYAVRIGRKCKMFRHVTFHGGISMCNTFVNIFSPVSINTINYEPLLQVYKSYIQPRLNYCITLYGCPTQMNIDLVQRDQNHAARLTTGNFDYINCCGTDLFKSFNLCIARDRRDYCLA